MKKIVFISATALLAVVPAHATNLLSNSGFETGALSPWSQDQDYGGAENWNVTNNDAHTGLFSATDVGNKHIVQSFSAVSTALISEVSVWIKNPEASINAISLYYDDATVNEGLVFAPNGEWNQVNVTSWLQPGKNLVGFGVWGYSGGGSAEDRTFVDDAVVEAAVPEPVTLSVFGFGLAGILAKRRRK